MKNKKIIIPIVFIIVLLIVLCIYFMFQKSSLDEYIDNTIKYKDKINYNTNITLQMSSKTKTLKIDYDVNKSNNIKKIILKNYEDDELLNSILKYIVDDKCYVYDNEKYNLQKSSEEFYINYELLKNGKNIKEINKKEYIIKLKLSDAYNLIYKKQIDTKDMPDDIIDVKILIDDNNDFIKEISYTIDNLNKNDNNPLKYEVKIINSNINNKDSIKLPFEE